MQQSIPCIDKVNTYKTNTKLDKQDNKQAGSY